MILIDTVYINNGGGKILLDYLISHLENLDEKFFYIFDIRIKPHNYHIKATNKIIYLRPNLLDRYDFYNSHRNTFSKVFVLGNIPPLVKLNCSVITYFHSPLYIKVPKDYSWFEKIKYQLKVNVLKYASKNTDKWLVQSEEIKQQFIHKFGQESKLEIVPFYPELINQENVEREKNTFIYVSNAQAHKNHMRLIDAFCKAYDKSHKGRLILTVNDAYPKVLDLINKKISENYPIENIGFVDRKTLSKWYAKTEYLIFPSLAESFGLGLIEAISMGCKVIGANLPYTYAVCEPSAVFDPTDIKSIEEAIIQAVHTNLGESRIKIKNDIEFLLDMLC